MGFGNGFDVASIYKFSQIFMNSIADFVQCVVVHVVDLGAIIYVAVAPHGVVFVLICTAVADAADTVNVHTVAVCHEGVLIHIERGHIVDRFTACRTGRPAEPGLFAVNGGAVIASCRAVCVGCRIAVKGIRSIDALVLGAIGL